MIILHTKYYAGKYLVRMRTANGDEVTRPGSAQLEDLLCFDLYSASRAVTATYRPMLDQLGLTYPQYLVLIVAGSQEARPIKEIAEELRLDHGTLTPLLRRLEARGLLIRNRSAADERSVLISLTKEGHRVRAEFHQIQCRLADLLGLDGDEFALLQRLLKRVTARTGGG